MGNRHHSDAELNRIQIKYGGKGMFGTYSGSMGQSEELTVGLWCQGEVVSARLQSAHRHVRLCPSALIQHAGVDGGAWSDMSAGNMNTGLSGIHLSPFDPASPDAMKPENMNFWGTQTRDKPPLQRCFHGNNCDVQTTERQRSVEQDGDGDGPGMRQQRPSVSVEKVPRFKFTRLKLHRLIQSKTLATPLRFFSVHTFFPAVDV